MVIDFSIDTDRGEINVFYTGYNIIKTTLYTPLTTNILYETIKTTINNENCLSLTDNNFKDYLTLKI